MNVEWISVQERLPDDEIICVAYMRTYRECVIAEYDGDGEWFDRADLRNITRLVTHWFSLPKEPVMANSETGGDT